MKAKRIVGLVTIILVITAILMIKSKSLPKAEVLHFETKTNFHDGDLIFQTSQSAQSKAIQLATKSQYSHCGIIYIEDGNYYVLEALDPVKLTSLSTWIVRGKDKKYVVKRLQNAEKVLNQSIIYQMKNVGNSFIGKHYDLTFEWSDEKIYCSELIYKIYERGAHISVGKLQKLANFDLSNDIVKQKLKTRYGSKIPLGETVISPQAIFESKNLITVTTNQ